MNSIRENGINCLTNVIDEENSILVENILYIKLFEFYNIEKITLKDFETIYNDHIYEILGMSYNNYSVKSICKDIYNNKFKLNKRIYDSWKECQDELDDLLAHPLEIVEGISECFKCKSKRILTYQIQTRSCDETSTTFMWCIKCNNKWKYSG
jgi:transcription elongation factor S-II